MKTPSSLAPLIEDGLIDEVIRPLRSGKEAEIFLVACGEHIRCAKVYKDLQQRAFQQRAQYQEGRRVSSSRQARAMGKRTRFGRKTQETAWKSAEADALKHLMLAGVQVPETFGFVSGVLIMELIVDADGDPAPNLGELELSEQRASEFHEFLIKQIVIMLCAGLIHGDLSEYNVLVDIRGPVIIDLPQVVSATGNNNSRSMLLRDVANITACLGRSAPRLLATRYGEEMWSLFEHGQLRPESELTGKFEGDNSEADVDGVLLTIEDAREEAERRAEMRALDAE